MIRIGKLLTPNLIKLQLTSKGKDEVLKELVDIFIKNGVVGEENRAEVLRCIMERESVMTTGIGGGVAIPHGKSFVVDKIIVCFGRSPHPIDFQALDKQPVNMFFMVVAPKNSKTGSATDHIKTLARISRLLKHPYIRQQLSGAKTPEEVIEILVEADDNQ